MIVPLQSQSIEVIQTDGISALEEQYFTLESISELVA